MVLNSRYALYVYALALGLLSALLLYSTYYLAGRGTYWAVFVFIFTCFTYML